MASYIAIIHREEGSDYGVSFPDFPGCITAGSTVDEAKDMAGEALSLHVKGMLEDGETIPEPMSLAEAMKHELAEGALVFFLIPAPERLSKVVRVTITVPENDLHEIDKYARKIGASRSSFLVNSAKAAARTMTKDRQL